MILIIILIIILRVNIITERQLKTSYNTLKYIKLILQDGLNYTQNVLQRMVLHTVQSTV